MRKKTQIIKFKNLKRKSGLYYIEDISEPFSGIAETWVGGHLVKRLRLENGKHDGMTEHFHDNGELSYRVFFIEGIRQWSEHFFYESGELECRREYKNGNFHCQEYFYENGQLQSKTHFIMIDYRTFVDGLQEGFHMNGQLSFSKNYKNGHKDGAQFFFDTEGNLERTEIWENGGRKSLKNHAEELAERNKLDHRLHMQDRIEVLNLDGMVWFTKDDKVLLRNDGIRYWANSNKPICGCIEILHENGEIGYRGNFKDGKNEGLEESFFKNGQLSRRVNYRNGKKHGLFERFHENGEIRMRRHYKNGKDHGLFATFSWDGELSFKLNYKNGEKHGLYEYYNTAGIVHLRGYFKDGKRDGPFRRFYKDGQIEKEQYYKNGQKEGLFEYFDQSGRCTTRIKYKNGRRVRK